MANSKMAGRFRVLLALGAALVASMAQADVVYTYTGNALNRGDSSMIGRHVSVTLDFLHALAPNTKINIPHLADHVSAGLLSYGISGGGQQYTDGSAYNHMDDFLSVSTDGSGNISNWEVAIFPLEGSILTQRDEDLVLEEGGLNLAYNYSKPGTWTLLDTTVPEPGTLALALGAVFALSATRRRSSTR
ncbi:PEP-CTERM sorting domain-containing protein [Roseateles koreensis]|uniref:PEP-CTERM sorting domain-containing protein n=1 Tax=Roseateles koreensis TaxID=2987526 RepID=A0ABT5KPI4_9BURK|nr:PEP-CTERM sorting domain-containing protein [Roseateles koreensis]MDC8784828.1 PEP-CTERM sorting domain-containing protein [Roseateles koreensis]